MSNGKSNDTIVNAGEKISQAVKAEILHAVKGDLLFFTNFKCTGPDEARAIGPDIVLEVAD